MNRLREHGGRSNIRWQKIKTLDTKFWNNEFKTHADFESYSFSFETTEW
jgi:hypothetical protein